MFLVTTYATSRSRRSGRPGRGICSTWRNGLEREGHMRSRHGRWARRSRNYWRLARTGCSFVCHLMGLRFAKETRWSTGLCWEPCMRRLRCSASHVLRYRVRDSCREGANGRTVFVLLPCPGRERPCRGRRAGALGCHFLAMNAHHLHQKSPQVSSGRRARHELLPVLLYGFWFLVVPPFMEHTTRGADRMLCLSSPVHMLEWPPVPCSHRTTWWRMFCRVGPWSSSKWMDDAWARGSRVHAHSHQIPCPFPFVPVLRKKIHVRLVPTSLH
jgi:hypothetical protein